MSNPDYSDTTKYNVQGGTVPQYYPIGYPQRIDSDPLISNYILALNPQWNNLLNPNIQMPRESMNIVRAKKALGNNAEIRNKAQEYFKTNPMPYSNPADPSIDYSLPVQQAQEYAISIGKTYEFEEFKNNNESSDSLPSYVGSIEYAVQSIPQTVNLSVSNISEKSASINWTPNANDIILKYHFVLVNQSTGQTIKETNLLSGQRNSFEQNLTANTNYKAYLIAINARGNSPESSISFKTLEVDSVVTTPVVTLSAETISIINKFNTGIYQIVGNYPLDLLIETVKNGKMTNQNFIQTVKANLEYGQFIDTSIPEIISPIIDTSINSMMISQSIGAFILKNGRVKGEILYIANQSFNPFYYGKNLASLVQIKSKSGVPIAIKPNVLNFTNTERDERIQIDEAVGNFKELVIDFFVWESLESPVIFSENKQIQVVEESPDPECQVGYHKDFSGKCVPDDPLPEIPRDKLIDTLKGFLFGTVALSLLARKY